MARIKWIENRKGDRVTVRRRREPEAKFRRSTLFFNISASALMEEIKKGDYVDIGLDQEEGRLYIRPHRKRRGETEPKEAFRLSRHRGGSYIISCARVRSVLLEQYGEAILKRAFPVSREGDRLVLALAG